MRIEIVVFDGFDELDAVAPYEVLRNAAAGGADWDVALVGAHGAGVVTGSHGLQLTVTERLSHPDALIAPGGGWGEHAERGTWGEVQRGLLPDRIAALAPGCRWVASVCTGAMLLAAAGLTRGRPAVTHHVAVSDLAATGAQVIEDAASLTTVTCSPQPVSPAAWTWRYGSSNAKLEPRWLAASPTRSSTSAHPPSGPATTPSPPPYRDRLHHRKAIPL